MNESVENYWTFLDKMPETEIVASIRGYSSTGMELIASLKASPLVSLGTCSIDFNAAKWDLTSITTSNVPPSHLKMTFKDTALDDAIKLFLICSIVWRKAKVQSLMGLAKRVRKFLNDNDICFDGIVLLTANDVLDMLDAKRVETSVSNAKAYADNLYSFLEFFDRMLYRLSEYGFLAAMEAYSRKCATLTRAAEGYPMVPAAYFDPLITTCMTAMRDDEELIDFRITAAALLLISQTGLRNSHFLGTKVGALHISKGVAGKPDIVYMDYGDSKGSHENNVEIKAHTMINDIALEAYLWLEENCRPNRNACGVDTLVVYPKQKARYCICSSFLARAKRFILFHHDVIPCINSQNEFADLSVVTVDEILKGYSDGFCRRENLKPDDAVVYPVIHSLRVTVATKLQEQGVDLHYIRKHMNQLSEDVTAGYIRSNSQIEKANSDLVYRTIFEDGAKLIGQHADEFLSKVNATLSSLDAHVSESIDEIVGSASKHFPLRSKLGGVCIRCGNVAPCSVSDSTDEILCAFGVCPNQCYLYFMASDTLATVRNRMRLVDENIAKGQLKAARNELRKAQNTIGSVLIPELDSLKEQLASLGADRVLDRFPNLQEIVENEMMIDVEVKEWQQTTI